MSRKFLDPAAACLEKAEQALDAQLPEIAAGWQAVAKQWAELARIDKNRHTARPARKPTNRPAAGGFTDRPGTEDATPVAD